MAVVLKEKPDSPTFSVDAQGARLTRGFFARGTDDETTLYAAILAQTDPVYDGLIRTGIRTPVKAGGGYWGVEVEYGDPSGNGSGGAGGSGGTPVGETPVNPTSIPGDTTPLDPVTQGIEFTFDASAETKHVTQSLETTSSTKRGGGTPPNFKGAIGVTKDGSVSGCDIFTRKSEFTATVQRAEMTLGLFRTYVGMVATLNDDTWGGFETNSVIYLGCNAQGTQRGQWTVTHRFAAGEHRTNVTICDGLVVGFVGAWEYLWVYYLSDPDPTTGGLSIPEAAYTERVYHNSAFSALEIGV